MSTWIISLRNTILREELHVEEFEGDRLADENRLSDIWNERAAHMPGRGLQATMRLSTERHACSSIGG